MNIEIGIDGLESDNEYLEEKIEKLKAKLKGGSK